MTRSVILWHTLTQVMTDGKDVGVERQTCKGDPCASAPSPQTAEWPSVRFKLQDSFHPSYLYRLL